MSPDSARRRGLVRRLARRPARGLARRPARGLARRPARGPAPLWLAAGAVIALFMAGCGTAGSGAGGPGPGSGGSGGPATPSSPASAVTIARDNANGKTMHLGAGGRLELILSSTYWNVQGSSAPAVLRQDGPASLLPRPSTCPDIPGLGCVPVRTSFTALAPGTAVITATRTMCGEALRCAASQRTFRLTVVVS